MKSKSLCKKWYALLMAVVLCTTAAGCGAFSEVAETPQNENQEEGESSKAGDPQEVSAEDGDTIKVGILHSLSGTMAISETSVRDAELLAIKEINENGGVLGKQIEPVIEDGASDNAVFAEKAEKLL